MTIMGTKNVLFVSLDVSRGDESYVDANSLKDYELIDALQNANAELANVNSILGHGGVSHGGDIIDSKYLKQKAKKIRQGIKDITAVLDSRADDEPQNDEPTNVN